MNMQRGKGYLPDEQNLVDEDLNLRLFQNKHLVGSIIPPFSVDYTSLLDRIADQGSTSSCVGQAFATSLYLTAKNSGHEIPRPSAKAIYDFARLQDQPYEKMIDEGSNPRKALRALVERGIFPEDGVVGDGSDAWRIEFDSFGKAININKPPPLDIYQQALGVKVDDYSVIRSGVGAFESLRQVLAQGYCPVFAMPVDEAFEMWNTAAVYPGRKGTILGYHMQAIGGYNGGALTVIGSWGLYFANQGIVKIDRDYIDSGECTDFIVVKTIAKS